MKKTWNRLLALGLAGMLCGSFAACTPPTPGPDNSSNNDISSSSDERVDTDKYQLNVSNFDGGYGSAWLGEIKKRYEAAHANDVYEGGKTGVQVMIHPIKSNAGAIAESVLDGVDDVYFTEYAYYYDLLGKGIFEDITDAVTGDLGVYDQGDAAGTTIESKLTEQQKNYYKTEDGKYYGIPHYAGYGGLTYNKRFFNENYYYFAATPSADGTLQGKFITPANPVKSNGPDGKAGTFDDGLPSTYEEFFWLCDWIESADQTPVILNGNNYKDYAQYLTKALATDYEGLEQMMLNYTFDGTANSLATIDASGNVVIDETPTAITVNNGYELARQAGKAYAVSFIEKMLMGKDSAYMNPDFDSSSLTHMGAQEDFLRSVADGDDAAMLIEGIWWQSEATQAFNDAAAEFGDEYSKRGSDFAWMPLPKATADKVGEGVTLFDQIYSLCFMKKGLTGEAKEVALDFIKFCYTQDSLVEFTQVTDTPKAVTYSMDADDMASLTPFARSILTIKNCETTNIVYPYASSKFYQTNQTALSNLFMSTVDNVQFTFEAEVFVTGGGNFGTKDFFNGIKTYRQSQWANWMANVTE